MSWVDIVIIVAVALGVLRGRSEGALRQIASLAGLVVGFLVATMVAPRVSSQLTHASWRPLLALGIVLVGSMLGSYFGGVLGMMGARSLRALKLGAVDRIAGAALGGIGSLVVCWLLAGLLGSVTWGSLATGIQNSRILAVMDRAMPPLPAMEARVQALFRSAGFPAVFASIVAPTLAPVATPSQLGPLVSGLGGPSSVVKVLASGACGAISQGTAFFVSAHLAVTNAHVVAGYSRVSAGGAVAQVVLYDPLHDIAILRVPSLNEPALHFQTPVPTRGTPVQVIGFPLDSSRTGAPGVIEGELSGQGRDIYNQRLFDKTMLAVSVSVQPGNSGSPVLDRGLVAGVIESKSLSQSFTAYAIPNDVVQHDIAIAPASGTASTQGCLP
jgi:uncharacterized membrane protein required for colicin V production